MLYYDFRNPKRLQIKTLVYFSLLSIIQGSNELTFTTPLLPQETNRSHVITFRDTMQNILLPLADVVLTKLLVSKPKPEYQFAQSIPVDWHHQLFGHPPAKSFNYHSPNNAGELYANSKLGGYNKRKEEIKKTRNWTYKNGDDTNKINYFANPWSKVVAVAPKAVAPKAVAPKKGWEFSREDDIWSQLPPYKQQSPFSQEISRFSEEYGDSEKIWNTFYDRDNDGKQADIVKYIGDAKPRIRKVETKFNEGKSRIGQVHNSNELDPVTRYRNAAKNYGLVQRHSGSSYNLDNHRSSMVDRRKWTIPPPDTSRQEQFKWAVPQPGTSRQSQTDQDRTRQSQTDPARPRQEQPFIQESLPINRHNRFEYKNDQRTTLPVVLPEITTIPPPADGLAWDMNQWAHKHSTGRPTKYYKSSEIGNDYPDWYKNRSVEKPKYIDTISNKLMKSKPNQNTNKDYFDKTSNLVSHERNSQDGSIILKLPISFEEAKYFWTKLSPNVRQQMTNWLYAEFLEGNLG